LDTVGTVYPYRGIKIKNIVWANFTTVGDTFLLRDLNGKDIINAVVASISQGMMTFGNFEFVNGLVLVTLTHGEVTIGIGAGK